MGPGYSVGGIMDELGQVNVWGCARGMSWGRVCNRETSLWSGERDK